MLNAIYQEGGLKMCSLKLGGGGAKIHPRRRNFNPVGGGGGQVSRLEKNPKLKKCPVLGVYPGPLFGLRKCISVAHG